MNPPLHVCTFLNIVHQTITEFYFQVDIYCKPMCSGLYLPVMKIVAKRVVFRTVIALLLANLMLPTLTNCKCLGYDGDAELETVCQSPCAQDEQLNSGVNSHELFVKANNTRECSYCIVIVIDLPYRSARLLRAGSRGLGIDLHTALGKSDLSDNNARDIMVRALELTGGHFYTFAQSQLESTVLRC
jgi:hypothetical protein